MGGYPSRGRLLLVGLIVVALLAGCAAGATPSVTKTSDVAYESANPVLKPGMLDVYVPTKAGPWPVVVMFHGAPQMVWKSDLSNYARKVADLGFVVFVPDWGHETAGGATSFTYEAQVAVNSQAACAVAFAQAHAAEYGGDPATMIVFGRWGAPTPGPWSPSPGPSRRQAASGAPRSARSTRWSPGRAAGSCPFPRPGMTPPSPPTRGSWTS